MATLYSAEEIAAIGRSGAVCAGLLREAAAAAESGASGTAIDALVRRRLEEAGAAPALAEQTGASGRFPGAISISTEAIIANGAPGDGPTPGELVRLDLAVRLDGWVCDAATTVAAPEAGAEARRLLAAAREVVGAAIGAMAPDVRWADIVRAGRTAAAEAGVHIAGWPWGHGVGRRLHEPPALPGDPEAPGADFELRRGMVLAIEPIVLGAPARLALAPDGWSIVAERPVLAACEERTVAVTGAGAQILTPLD